MGIRQTTRRASSNSSELSAWFHRACRDEPGALQELLALYRPLLLKLANRQLKGALRVKVAPSDLVQITLWNATCGFKKQQFESRENLLAWLLAILKNETINVRRKYRLAKSRDLSRERPLFGEETQEWLSRLSASLSANGSTFSVGRETIDQLLQTIERLPPHYRLVIRLRYFEKLDFGAIGALLERSYDAARVLHSRAITRLRDEMNK
jgi:RNA polymerase sigma-70 factor (subfamily 1)